MIEHFQRSALLGTDYEVRQCKTATKCFTLNYIHHANRNAVFSLVRLLPSADLITPDAL